MHSIKSKIVVKNCIGVLQTSKPNEKSKIQIKGSNKQKELQFWYLA